MVKKEFLHFGGHPLLDFCNTLILHANETEDRLLGSEDDENFVYEFFSVKPKFNIDQHKDLIELRDLLTKYFHHLIGLKKKNVLNELNKWLSEHSFILQISDSHATTYASNKQQNHFAPFIESLHSFLHDLELSRLRKCANPNCSHLFYDVSKNNKRQWCSMNSCGNIMKARAFYARKKKENDLPVSKKKNLK